METDHMFKYDCNYFKTQNTKNSFHMKSYQSELEKSRAEDIKSVMKSVNEVRSDFENLKSEVYNLTKNPEYLKDKLYNIEEKISQLKEAIREELLSLLREEVNLSKDVYFVEKRFEEWGKPVDFQKLSSTKKVNYSVRSTNNDNPALEFQKFISCSGGRYGGWEEHDHLLFLRERNKHKKKEKFISVVKSLLPDLSYNDIEEHEIWYEKYVFLKNSQKEAIQKWRSEKENKQKNNKESRGGEEKKKIKKSVRHQIDIAERIKEWKVWLPNSKIQGCRCQQKKIPTSTPNQQLLKKLEEEERQIKEKEKLKEEEKRKKDIQKIKKQAVAQYKSEKLNKLQESSSKEDNTLQTEEAKLRNKILLKGFRLQDLKFIEKKKIIKLQFESKSNEKFERLKLAKPALELILQRNPQRIFQPTLIWSQHCVENQKKEKFDQFFDLNSIPRLAIPEWRRELK